MPVSEDTDIKPGAEKHVSNLVNNLPVNDEGSSDSEQHVGNLVNNLPTDEDTPSLSDAVYGSPSDEDQSDGQSTSDHLSDAYEDANDLSGGKLDEYKDEQIDKVKDRLSPNRNNQANVNNAAGSADKASKAVDSGQKSADLASTASNTEKVADTGQKVASAGAKVAQGAEVAEGAALTAEGATLAAAPETLGASLIATAAIEGGKQAGKIAKLVKKGVQIKEAYEKLDKRVKKVLKCCTCCLLPFIIIAVVAGFSVQELFQLDSTGKIKDKIDEVMNKDIPGPKLNFTDPASEEAIKNNDIGASTFQAMVGLSTHFNGNAEIHYKGAPSAATGKENQPYEFDLLSADFIKCTDTLNNKKIEPPIKISMDSSLNWSSYLSPGMEDYLCAVSYYPSIEPPVVNASPINTGEFTLKDIASAGPVAAQSKIYESVEIALSNNAELIKSSGGFPITKILIPANYYEAVLPNGQTLGGALKIKAKEIFPESNPDEIIKRDTKTKGIHVGFD